MIYNQWLEKYKVNIIYNYLLNKYIINKNSNIN